MAWKEIRKIEAREEKMMGMKTMDSRSLSKLQVIGLISLLVLFIVFGGVTEFRGAFLKHHRTDIGCYLRAAWAVRAGTNMYDITDDNGWHYNYPPLLAILMTPLADPPQGASRAGYLPYAVTVGIWYVVTTLFLAAGIEILARALEDPVKNLAAGRGSRFSALWWDLRIIPLLVVLPAIGRAQVRGQVDVIIGFLLCCMIASILNGRRFRAGLWLSFAICIKVIPALLLALPLWRRDWRMLYGCAGGLLIGLVLIPVIVLGPGRTAESYKTFYKQIIVAGLAGSGKGSRAAELTGITRTDSNAPMVVLNNILHPDMATRPKVASPLVRATQWMLAFIMLALTLILSGWKGRWYSGKVDATIAEACFMGALIPLMFTTSPMFHPHYVSMTLPLVIVLFVLLWEKYSYGHIPSRWKALFWFIAVSHLLTSLDQGPFNYLREFGLVLASTIALWIGALIAAKKSVQAL